MSITKQELIEGAYEITGGDIRDLTVAKLERLMTVTQHVTDLCLNELERRGEIGLLGGYPVVPYICDYMVETILTRHTDGL